MTFTEEQIQRYARHIILPEVGGAGQSKLLDSRVLIVGAGGLGSPAAMYLAAAGVGTIVLADADIVDLTNLQRQILHGTADVGRPKTTSGAETIHELNPEVTVEIVDSRIDPSNVMDLVSSVDVVVDGSDNFPTRYLLNDACWLTSTPLVSGAIFRFEGQLSVFDRRVGGSPCYRCVFPEAPPDGTIPNCAQAGIFGAVAGVVGCLQAAEGLKVLLSLGDPLIGTLLLFDALETRFTRIALARDPRCRLCGDDANITSIPDPHEVTR